MPNFELYERGSDRRNGYGPAAVTIQRKRGLIGFNAAAMSALGHPGAVVFLVDKGERLLGFRPAEDSDEGKVASVRPPGAMVSALPVLKYLEVNLDQSRRYPLAELDGVLCIDFKRPGEVVRGNRSKD